MKLLRVLLAFAVVLTILIFFPVKSVPPCPHHTFITNHLCSHCYTLQDAAVFTESRPKSTLRNTVFFGRPKFEVKTYLPNRCGNVDGAPAAICTMDFTSSTEHPAYTCNWLGKSCYAEHSLTNGHLYYADVKCTY